ncbi:MAG: hypothetical protein R2708_20980 [Vicinamibacterales bacterium]
MTDVENLRLHYARTLAAWHPLEASAAEVVTFDDVRPRLAAAPGRLGGAARTGSAELFQVGFSRLEAELPWTRAALYATPLAGHGAGRRLTGS